MFWNFGNGVKAALWTVHIRLECCWCERRRMGLNSFGEWIWKSLLPTNYTMTRNSFCADVITRLGGRVVPGDVLLKDYPEHWLDEMVKLGQISVITLSGRRWYSLRK